MAPGVLAQRALTRRVGQRVAQRLVGDQLVGTRLQLLDTAIEYDLAPWREVPLDVRLRVRQLRRAHGGELEHAHVGARAVARRIASRTELLMHVDPHRGAAEGAYEVVAVQGAPRPPRPPGREAKLIELTQDGLAHRIARPDEHQRRAPAAVGRK